MEIKMYTTTWCGYCKSAKKLLSARNIPFQEIDCTNDGDIRDKLVEETGRTSVPQIFVDGVPIGGFDDLNALDRKGDLAKIIAGEQKPRSIRV